MIIMKRSIPHDYTYGNFIEDLGIDIEAFNRFNNSTTDTDKKKRLTTRLSGEKNGNFEEKIKDVFEAVFYLENARKKEEVVQMDFLYNGDYIFKGVTVQTFILQWMSFLLY